MDTDWLALRLAVGHELVHTLVFALLVGCVFAPLELAFPSKAQPARTPRAYIVDTIYATLGATCTRVTVFIGLGALLVLVQAVCAMVHLGSASALRSMPSAARIALGLFVFELGGYAYHRAAHRVSWLWKLHSVHHSSERVDWLAAFRQHPLEIVLMTLAQNLPLVILGIPLGEHSIIVGFLAFNTVFVHANVSTPSWLQRVVATPAFHHRHHETDAPNANFATMFPWMDSVFGSASR